MKTKTLCSTLLYSEEFLTLLRKNPVVLNHVLKCVLPNVSLKISNLISFEEKKIYPVGESDRSVIIYAEDMNGKPYDIDLVITDRKNHVMQARLHANCLIYCGRYNEEDNAEVYTIMLTDSNLLGENSNKPVSHIEWICEETGLVLPDADHIIYTNGEYEDDSTDIGKLIFDFKQTDLKKLKSAVLKEAFHIS